MESPVGFIKNLSSKETEIFSYRAFYVNRLDFVRIGG